MRDDLGRGALGPAMATRKQLEAMGRVSEIEPGVLSVVLPSGRVLRWTKVFNTDLWQLCAPEGG